MDLESFWIWMGINVFSLLTLSAYSMLEMACISFDRVRLQYFLTRGDQKVNQLNYLISNSARLFGTTLIGVNIALVVGSESARQISSILGFSPDLAVIPQVIIVILFGELAPMFAARRYPEHIVQIGVGLVYYSAKLLAPILYLIDFISNLLTRLMGSRKGHHEIFLGREELQKILEVHEEPQTSSFENRELGQIISNIFTIDSKSASSIVRPLNSIKLIPSNCTVGELRHIILNTTQGFFPIIQEKTRDVVGVVFPRDLLRAPDNRRIRDYARPPWFIEFNMKLLDVLKQFRSNHESQAIVLDQKGKMIGYLTLDHVIESIFGNLEVSVDKKVSMVIDRTLDPNITVKELEEKLGIVLDLPKDLDFSEYCIERLDGHPRVEDSFTLDSYEITILESSVFEIQRIRFKTKLF